jgi:hypothetical protein
MSRSLLVLIAGTVALGSIAVTPALGAAAPTTVTGPYGVGIVAPPAALACDAELRLGVRFTRAARRAGVRFVQVRLRGTKLGLTVPFRAAATVEYSA